MIYSWGGVSAYSLYIAGWAVSTYSLYTAGEAMSSNLGNFACAKIRRPLLRNFFLYSLKKVTQNSNFGMSIHLVSVNYMSNFMHFECGPLIREFLRGLRIQEISIIYIYIYM